MINDSLTTFFVNSGMLSRKDAEKKLSKKAEGTFLVRLSTQIFGYAISLRVGWTCFD